MVTTKPILDFHPPNPQGRRRELTPTNCPLTYKYLHYHRHKINIKNKAIVLKQRSGGDHCCHCDAVFSKGQLFSAFTCLHPSIPLIPALAHQETSYQDQHGCFPTLLITHRRFTNSTFCPAEHPTHTATVYLKETQPLSSPIPLAYSPFSLVQSVHGDNNNIKPLWLAADGVLME